MFVSASKFLDPKNDHTNEEQLAKLTTSDNIINKAYQVLDQFYWTKDEIAIYEREKKSQLDAIALLDAAKIEGETKGRAEGEAKGRAEAKSEMAKAMQAEGISPELIERLTGISLK